MNLASHMVGSARTHPDRAALVQRILDHASAAMTTDLYDHMVDQKLWDAADRVGESTGGLSSDVLRHG
jgi:integrase